MSIKNAELLDKLLDQWELDASNNKGITNYFTQITTGAVSGTTDAFVAIAGATAPPNVNDIKKRIEELYLVFHYPQYTLGKPTEFDPKDTSNTKPSIIPESHGIFNYVSPEVGSKIGKRLLSSAGISKKNMITLKMVIDKLKSTTDTKAFITVLLEESPLDITALILGGNTSDILPKNTGGKHNRSNKRIKKQPKRRNKSSKSLR